MSFTDDDRREFRRDSNFLGGQATKWVIIAVVLVALIGAAAWGISVLTAGPKGRGDAYRQQQSAENWTRAQAEFNRRYQGILAQDKKITIAAAALKRDPESARRQVEYDGLVRNCADAVAQYNSLAREYLAEQFRDADLPSQIDDTDPATDCKEN